MVTLVCHEGILPEWNSELQTCTSTFRMNKSVIEACHDSDVTLIKTTLHPFLQR